MKWLQKTKIYFLYAISSNEMYTYIVIMYLM